MHDVSALWFGTESKASDGGIDYYSAMTIPGEIRDMARFSNPKKLVSYAGLAPGMRASIKDIKGPCSEISSQHTEMQKRE